MGGHRKHDGVGWRVERLQQLRGPLFRLLCGIERFEVEQTHRHARLLLRPIRRIDHLGEIVAKQVLRIGDVPLIL